MQPIRYLQHGPSAQRGGSLSLASLVWLACWIIGMINTRRLAKKGKSTLCPVLSILQQLALEGVERMRKCGAFGKRQRLAQCLGMLWQYETDSRCEIEGIARDVV